MHQSTITVRYAKAFFSSAKEKNMLDSLKTDMKLVDQVSNTAKDFILLLESPIVKTSKKIELVSEIFKGKIDDLTLKFLQLIAKNKREAYIPGIARNFLDLVKKDQNIKSAMVTTATEIAPATIKKIEAVLGSELHAQIELSAQVNPDIVGGMILRIGDKQYDASIATQLKNIKQELLDTELR